MDEENEDEEDTTAEGQAAQPKEEQVQDVSNALVLAMASATATCLARSVLRKSVVHVMQYIVINLPFFHLPLCVYFQFFPSLFGHPTYHQQAWVWLILQSHPEKEGISLGSQCLRGQVKDWPVQCMVGRRQKLGQVSDDHEKNPCQLQWVDVRMDRKVWEGLGDWVWRGESKEFDGATIQLRTLLQ